MADRILHALRPRTFRAALSLLVEAAAPSYLRSMSQWANTSKRLVSVLMAAFLAFALLPATVAMPAPHQAMAQTAMAASKDGAPPGKTACAHARPQQHRGMPCNCMGNCPDMAGCSIAAVLPILPHVAHLTAARLPIWRLLDDRPETTLQPANPPPIG